MAKTPVSTPPARYKLNTLVSALNKKPTIAFRLSSMSNTPNNGPQEAEELREQPQQYRDTQHINNRLKASRNSTD
jgi:hypothetical protein